LTVVTRRGRWGFGAVLLLVAAGLLGGQAWRAVSRAAERRPMAPGGSVAAAISPPAELAKPAASALSVDLPASAAQAGDSKRPATAEATPGTVEFCGYGRMSREAFEAALAEEQAPAWVEAVNAQHETQRQTLLKRLAAGSAPQRVAAALLSEDVAGAAQIAASTDDPLAYQLALSACRRDAAYRASVAWQQAWLKTPAASGVGPADLLKPPPGPEPGHCAALSLERLEAMAPDAALPWLLRLSDARDRKDDTGVSEALYQLVQRPGLRFKPRALSGVVADLVGDEPTPGDTLALTAALDRDFASALDGSLANIGRVCRDEDLRDANRRQLCERFVRQMSDHATELLDGAVLYNLENRLGLSHGPMSLSPQERDRMMHAMGERGFAVAVEPSCANFRRSGQAVMGMARQGEIAYWRAQAKRPAASAPR
jgi:hypothetical protein